MIHVDLQVVKDCKHPDWTYGEICVKCGDCGRFDKDYICMNCGYTEGGKPLGAYRKWGFVETYDSLNTPICPKCKPLFKSEDRTRFRKDIKLYGFSMHHKIIPCYIKDFVKREAKSVNEGLIEL